MGAVAVPLNGWWTGKELEYGLQDSGSKVFVCDAERYRRAAPFLGSLGCAAILCRSFQVPATAAKTQPRVELFSDVLSRSVGTAPGCT